MIEMNFVMHRKDYKLFLEKLFHLVIQFEEIIRIFTFEENIIDLLIYESLRQMDGGQLVDMLEN